MESQFNLLEGSKLTKNEIKRRLNKMMVPFNPELTQKTYFIEKYDNAVKDPEKRKWIQEEILKDNNQAQVLTLKRVRDLSPLQNEDIKISTEVNGAQGESQQQKRISTFSVVKVPLRSQPEKNKPINSINPRVFKYNVGSTTNVVPVRQDNVEERRNQICPINVNKRRTIATIKDIQPVANVNNESSSEDRGIDVNRRHSVDCRRNRNNEVYQASTSVDNARNIENYPPLRRVNNIAGYNKREEGPQIFTTYQRYNIGNNSTAFFPNNVNQSKQDMDNNNKGTNYSNIRRVDEPKQNVPNIVINRVDEPYNNNNYCDDFVDAPSKNSIQQDTSLNLSPIEHEEKFIYPPPQRNNPPNNNPQINPFSSYPPSKQETLKVDTHPSSGTFFPKKESSIYLKPSSYSSDVPYALLAGGLSIGAAILGYYYCLKNDISIRRYITSHISELSLPEPNKAIKEIKFDDFINTVLSPFKELTSMLLHPKRLLYNIIWKGLKYITKKLFWEYVIYTLPLVLLKAFLFFLYRRYKENCVAKEIFHSIKGILEDKLSGVNLNESDFSNEFEDGLTEREIITKYSELYHYTEKEFIKKIMPKLQLLRRKDPYMKIYETMIKGKRQIVWQLLH